MEIELPDGTVLDAPDDADIKKVVQGYRAAQAKKNTPDPTELMSPLQRSIAQFQLGVINTGRNIRDFTAHLGANELAMVGDTEMSDKIRKFLLAFPKPDGAEPCYVLIDCGMFQCPKTL